MRRECRERREGEERGRGEELGTRRQGRGRGMRGECEEEGGRREWRRDEVGMREVTIGRRNEDEGREGRRGVGM